MVLATNLTACEAFGLEAEKLCFNALKECHEEMDVVVRIALVIAIPLVLIGALFALKGLGNCGLGCKLIYDGGSRRGIQFESLDEFVHERPFFTVLKNPYRYYNHKWTVGMQFFTGVKDWVIAALPLAIAYLLFVVPQLILKSYCPQEAACKKMPVLGESACNATGEWLLKFIEEMIWLRSMRS